MSDQSCQPSYDERLEKLVDDYRDYERVREFVVAVNTARAKGSSMPEWSFPNKDDSAKQQKICECVLCSRNRAKLDTALIALDTAAELAWAAQEEHEEPERIDVLVGFLRHFQKWARSDSAILRRWHLR